MKKTLVTAAVLSAVAYIALPAQAADPLKTEVAAGEAYKVTAPAEKDGKLQKGQIAYKATNKTTVETVKGGAGSTLTFEKGNWQRVFNAEGVKGWDVSSFDKIDINVTNPTVTGPADKDGNTNYGFQSEVDVFHAWNGSSIKVHDIGTLNVNVDGLSAQSGQDPVVLHAQGGTIDINTKDAINVNLNGAGNVIMSQNSKDADGSVSLTSAKSISLYSKDSNVIVVGAIVDNDGKRTAAVNLKAPVINLKTDGADAAVINPYNIKWLSEKNTVGQPGSTNVSIDADELTLSAPKGFGIYVKQVEVKNQKTVAGTLNIKSNVKTTINSLGSAVHAETVNGTSTVTIASPVTELVSTAASQTTVEGTASTTVNFTGVNNGTTQVSVTSAGTNAVDVAGTLSATNAAVDVKKGNVNVSGELKADNSKVTLPSDGTASVNTLSGKNATIVFNQIKDGVVTVTTNKAENLKVSAGGELTAKYGTAEALVKALGDKTIAVDSKTYTLAGEESDLTSAWELDANGKVTYANGAAESPVLTAAKHANAANLAQWRYEVNHLSDRLGDVRNLRGTAGTWARVYGAEAEVSDSVTTKVRANTLQVGTDVALGQNWILGAAFGYTDSDSDFTVGSLDTDAYTLALYGSAFFDCGAYVDVIGRVGRLSSDIDMTRNFTASYDNTAFGLSAEVGYEWNVANGFYVTPQAELAYGFVKGDDYTAGNSVTVRQDDFKSLIGRLGIQTGLKFNEGKGNVYATVSVNHDFKGETNAVATQGANASQRLSEDLGGTWVSYGFGAQYNATDRVSLYGSVTRANGSDYQENYRYSVGVRFIW